MILPQSQKNRAGRSLPASALTLAALLMCFLASVISAPPASAHDQLLSTSPSTGEHLAQPPTSITLRLNAKPLNLGNEIVVMDQAGKDWASGDATLTDNGLIQRLTPGLPDAEYQVRWRVVSADGHPISGSYEFRIGTATAGSFNRAAQSRAAGTPAGSDADAQQADAASSDASGAPAWLATAAWAGAGALLGVGAYAGILAIRRHRSSQR